MLAELRAGVQTGNDGIGFDALREVDPRALFFAARTMACYQTDFYKPILHACVNFVSWTEPESRGANERTKDVWQLIRAADARPATSYAGVEAMKMYVEARTAASGAPPEG